LLSEQPSPSVGFLSRDQNNTIAGGVGIVVVSLVGLTLLSRWMIRICRPNEMLVVTGSRTNQGSQGLKGTKSLRWILPEAPSLITLRLKVLEKYFHQSPLI
ncbi:hypothetical protein OAL60_00450, partial [bacterium]|nr:hypothetical protein [bacterium]